MEKNNSGCLFSILKLFGISIPDQTGSHESDARISPADPLPYAKKEYLFSAAEANFLGVLNQAIQSEYLVFAKVRLADLFYVKKGTKKRQSFFNKIQSKHVDFVLCSKSPIKPVLAIELDDSTHQRLDRVQRDLFVDDLFKTAGLPLIHVAAKRTYNISELRDAIVGSLR